MAVETFVQKVRNILSDESVTFTVVISQGDNSVFLSPENESEADQWVALCLKDGAVRLDDIERNL